MTDTAAHQPLVKQAAQLLYKRLRVRVRDGRLLVGDFQCLDKQGNIILANTYEQSCPPDREGGEAQPQERHMGLVLVPFSQRVSCELEVMPGELDAIAALVELVDR